MATKIKRVILYIALILLAVICLLPFLLMIVNATRTGQEIVWICTCLDFLYGMGEEM